MEHRRRAELLIMEERQRAASHLQQVQRVSTYVNMIHVCVCGIFSLLCLIVIIKYLI